MGGGLRGADRRRTRGGLCRLLGLGMGACRDSSEPRSDPSRDPAAPGSELDGGRAVAHHAVRPIVTVPEDWTPQPAENDRER